MTGGAFASQSSTAPFANIAAKSKFEEEVVQCTTMQTAHMVRNASGRSASIERVLTIVSRRDAMHLAFRMTARFVFTTLICGDEKCP
jgi:hypothetical protein